MGFDEGKAMIRQHPQPAIKLIRSTPAKRYCTKHKAVRYTMPPPRPEANYVAAFIQFNHLKA